MRVAPLTLALSIVVACRRADHAPAAAQADRGQVIRATARQSLATAAPAPLEPGLDSACAVAMRLTREALGLHVARDTATNFASPREKQLPWHGCRLTGSSPGVQRDPANPVMPGGPLQAAFLGAGWKDDFGYGADGPDGMEMGMRKGEVLCHLAISYPGLDAGDDDSAAPPVSQPLKAIPYSLVIRCTRNAPPLAG